MGTNYYLVSDQKPPCECCNRPYEEERLHIGKSSAGWCFSLHVGDDVGTHSLGDWIAKWSLPGKTIVNEYGREIAKEEMLNEVIDRNWLRPPDWTPEEYRRNHAEPGPNGLLRHVLDGDRCIVHGDGPYDLITGEFF